MTWIIVGAIIMSPFLISGWRHERTQPRRGFIVELQIAEVRKRQRLGEISSEKAVEEVLILRFGAFSEPHLQQLHHMRSKGLT